jgi:hypothetical protein
MLANFSKPQTYITGLQVSYNVVQLQLTSKSDSNWEATIVIYLSQRIGPQRYLNKHKSEIYKHRRGAIFWFEFC